MTPRRNHHKQALPNRRFSRLLPAAIGILPTDYPTQAAYAAGQPIDPPPADFNPRPTQSPGTPTSASWTP